MKVCIIKNAEADNISAIFRVIDGIIDSGNECIILSRSRDYNSNLIKKSTIKFNNKYIDDYEICIKSIVRGGSKNIFNLLKYIFTVCKWLKDNADNYDIIHAFDLDAGLPTYLSTLNTKKRYIYHISDFYVDSRKVPLIVENFVRKLEFRVINKAKTTIICTEERKKQIKGSFPNNLVVVHNVPAINIKSEIDKIQKKPIRLAYVGGLTPNRFIMEMINSVKGDSRFLLELAGNGPLRTLCEEASEKYSNIKYYGEVKYGNALEIYLRCDLIFAIYNPIVRNHRYAAPNKFYESLMLSKGLIVCRNTSVDKLVHKFQNGMVVDYDVDSVKRELNWLCDNTDKIIEYKKNSNFANKFYSREEMINRIKHIYERE